MLHRDIELLDPVFKDKIKIFLSKLDEKGILYYIFETKRDTEVQTAYYAQGRKPLEETNALRKKAGLYLLSEADNKKKITWTMKSKHIEGKAIDIVPRAVGPIPKPWWGAPDVYYKNIAEVAKECDLNAGYFWEEKDAPHVELL